MRQPLSLYTSSYDCTIRGLNFETGVWHEAVDVDMHAADDHGEGQALISGFDVTHDGRIIWGRCFASVLHGRHDLSVCRS